MSTVPAAAKNTSAGLYKTFNASTWDAVTRSREFKVMSFRVSDVEASQYLRLRGTNLPDSILASLDYFDRIRTVPLKSAAGKACNWLLIQGETRDPAAISAAGWRKVWEGKRPGDRRDSDIFHLFRRDARANKTATLPDLLVTPPEAGMPNP
jgi:hypothetical protein